MQRKNDNDKKEYLPIHEILGANTYALIKTSTPARIGNMRQPIAKKSERDALRFIWVDNLESKRKTIYRVMRVLFGLEPSPFLLNGTLQQHFESYKDKHGNCIKELSDGIYVNDIHIGGNNVTEVIQSKYLQM